MIWRHVELETHGGDGHVQACGHVLLERSPRDVEIEGPGG